jgi:hypothetical protein
MKSPVELSIGLFFIFQLVDDKTVFQPFNSPIILWKNG